MAMTVVFAWEYLTIKAELHKSIMIFIIASNITINLCHPDWFCPPVFLPQPPADP